MCDLLLGLMEVVAGLVEEAGEGVFLFFWVGRRGGEGSVAEAFVQMPCDFIGVCGGGGGWKED